MAKGKSKVQTKVFALKSYYREEPGRTWGVSDYVYNVYEKGLLIRSVTLRGLRLEDVIQMFPESEIIEKEYQ